MRRLIRLHWTGVLLFALASRSSAEAAEVNVVSKVEVRGRAVEIVASRKPNFTTFTMTDPPRLVVDISEAVFAQVPEEMRVQNGTIRAIKTAGYGSGSSAIARVIIAFEHNVETDITPFGDHGLLVKMLGDNGPPAVAAAEAPASSPAPAERSSSPPAAESAPAINPVKPEAAEAADETKSAPTVAKGKRGASTGEIKLAPAVADAKPAPAAAEANPPVVAEAKPAPVTAEAKTAPVATEARTAPAVAKTKPAPTAAETKFAGVAAEPKPLEEAKQTADLASVERERAGNRAEALRREREEKEAKLREAEAKRQAKEERLRQIAAEEQKKKEEQRLAKQLERERAEAEAERRKQAEAEKKKKMEEARLAKRLEAQERAKAEQERRRQARVENQRKQEAAVLARQLERERVKAEKRTRRGVKVAATSTVQSDAAMEEPAPLRRQRPAGGRNLMTFVGFSQQASGSRVFVRTSGPVQYSVAQGGDKTIVLELENARIGLRNNSRPLDTSQFDSPVESIEPQQVAGQTVRVQIRLKDAVPYQAKQEGNEVFLDFGPPVRP